MSVAKWTAQMMAILRRPQWSVPQPSQLQRTLLLPLATIRTAPRFFTVLSLVLRASGYDIVVLADEDVTKKLARELELPFTEWRVLPNLNRLTKLGVARERVRRGPTIWIDLDFTGWPATYPDVSKMNGLVVLNWTELLGRFGPSQVGRA